LYLNKRWEYSSLVCTKCNYIYRCKNCDLSMNIHSNPDRLMCHHCWYNSNYTDSCIKCNKKSLKKVWIWTQQLEKILKDEFKNISIFRFDTDSVKNKTLKKQALSEINKSHIIIWTKMITTWFNFEKIWLIAVILFEQELSIPNYDTEEKVYCNIRQLIWRWNRKSEKTNIIIQTFTPKNNILKYISKWNYKDFFINSLKERKIFNYPPYSSMFILEYRDKDKQKAKEYCIKLENVITNEIWDNKTIELIFNKTSYKKNNSFFYRIIIKGKSLEKIKLFLKKIIIKKSNLSIQIYN
jgi:primosomal protein N' (replication factor Y)